MHKCINMFMRTTIDIPDELAIEAKKVAAERRTSLRKLVLAGLLRELQDPSPKSKDPLDQLKGLGSSAWQGIDANRYVAEQRKGWE